MPYILRALDKEGNTYFYTGKAGREWVSPHRYDAFEYQLCAARHRAKEFNKMEPVHGFWFLAVRLEEPVS